jgi:hypothetical protein
VTHGIFYKTVYIIQDAWDHTEEPQKKNHNWSDGWSEVNGYQAHCTNMIAIPQSHTQISFIIWLLNFVINHYVASLCLNEPLHGFVYPKPKEGTPSVSKLQLRVTALCLP